MRRSRVKRKNKEAHKVKRKQMKHKAEGMSYS